MRKCMVMCSNAHLAEHLRDLWGRRKVARSAKHVPGHVEAAVRACQAVLRGKM